VSAFHFIKNLEIPFGKVKVCFVSVRLECSVAPLEASGQNLLFHFGKPIRCPSSLQKLSDTTRYFLEVSDCRITGTECGNSHLSIGWPGLIGKCYSVFPWLVPLSSGRSVWHNCERPILFGRNGTTDLSDALREETYQRNKYWSLEDQRSSECLQWTIWLKSFPLN